MKFLITILALLSCSFPAKANLSETELAIKQLENIAGHLDYIRSNALHIQDEGRIYVLQLSVNEVFESVKKKGIGNLRTLNLYQQLIVKFRFSEQFFEFIRTKNTEKRIGEVLTTMKRILEQRGFDEDPFSKILKTNIDQIQSSLSQITKQSNTPNELTRSIQALYVPLAEASAEADQGDRPNAFDKAKEVYLKIYTLYPQLQQLNNNPTTFRYVLEVMGLNEFIAEYSQYKRK